MRNIDPCRETQGMAGIKAIVQAAQKGDVDARDTLLRDYQPFIFKVAASATRRYIRPGIDDEASVALMAFNQAIDRYDVINGPSSFLTFAQMIIKRRLVDYFREQAKFGRELPFSQLEYNGGEDRESAFMLREAETIHMHWEESLERRDEIDRFSKILAEYGTTLPHLLRATPKHKDTRQRLIRVSKIIANNAHFISQTRKRKALPVSDAVLFSGMSRKTVERHRIYLLALVLIQCYDLPCLKTYLEP